MLLKKQIKIKKFSNTNRKLYEINYLDKNKNKYSYGIISINDTIAEQVFNLNNSRHGNYIVNYRSAVGYLFKYQIYGLNINFSSDGKLISRLYYRNRYSVHIC